MLHRSVQNNSSNNSNIRCVYLSEDIEKFEYMLNVVDWSSDTLILNVKLLKDENKISYATVHGYHVH